MSFINKKLIIASALVVATGLGLVTTMTRPTQAAFEDLYRTYNTIDTSTWNRLEDIKASLGNPTFEGNDGTHYYIYQPLPRALKITNHVLVNTEGIWTNQYVPNQAIVLSGYWVKIRLNNYYTDITKDTNGWQGYYDMKNALGNPSEVRFDGNTPYYVYWNLPYSIRVSDYVRVNANGRWDSNYVPNGDVVSKGQHAIIRFNHDKAHDPIVMASSLSNDDAIRDIAQDRKVDIQGDGARRFTPTKNIYVDDSKYLFDWRLGRSYQGYILYAGNEVVMWRL